MYLGRGAFRGSETPLFRYKVEERKGSHIANRRMFSKDVVCTRNFLEMPPSCRALYYQLGIEADDDGFIDPYITMLSTKSQGDDLKLLVAKGFLVEFEGGVVVIRHWNQHNYIRKDTYTETNYKEQKRLLITGENGEYLSLSDVRQRAVNVPSTQDRLGKVRLGKDSIGEREGTALTPKSYSSKSDITEETLTELSQHYEVPIEFVRDCWDSAQNWCDARGKVQKNYKAFLSNWVKREKADYLLKARHLQANRRGGVVDARTK